MAEYNADPTKGGVKLTAAHRIVRSAGRLLYCSDACGRAAGLP